MDYKSLLQAATASQRANRTITALTGITNQNPVATVSEHFIALALEQHTGRKFQVLGSNVKGFDLLDLEKEETYEVKSTTTASTTYHYGNLVDKSADWFVFVKWQYGVDFRVEWCFLLPASELQANLTGARNRLTSTSLKGVRELGVDLTTELQQCIDWARA